MALTDPKQPETGGATLARHRVRDGIQRLILAGRFRPRQRLIQQELARRFGVAQSVVRESLLELQFCGLVEAVDNLGMFVSGLGPQTLIQAYQIREMFEGLAARLCCRHASRADLQELTDLARRTYQFGREENLEAMSALDRQFHYRTILASQNQLLARLTEGYRLLGMFVSAERDFEEVRREHLEIVEAIAADEPDRAEELARRHVRAAREAIEHHVAEDTFSPRWVAQSAEQCAAEGPLPAQPATPARHRKKDRSDPS